ncbi:MAG: hypothetical protein A2201_06485 [Alicyclobacillus sp. RIFOXYA1_FULL_53_8]|nr:MAG: hypothetical protein A2201_06485 [Alicyclobacillus sp. RIFOXYA1_FULL_53_8]
MGEVKNVLTFRSVLWNDRDLLLQWRNDAVTRANSITNTFISRPVHEAWLRDSLAQPKRKLMIIEDENLPIGVLRFDASEDGRVEVSIHLGPASRRKGFGRLALLQCEQLVKEWLPQAHELFAKVKRDNASSRRAFEAAGFVETRQTDEIIYFCKQTESRKHC